MCVCVRACMRACVRACLWQESVHLPTQAMLVHLVLTFFFYIQQWLCQCSNNGCVNYTVDIAVYAYKL